MALAGKNGLSLCAVPDAQIGRHVRPVAFAHYTSSLAAAEEFRRTRSRRTIYMQMLSRLSFTLQRVPFRKVHIPSGLDYRLALLEWCSRLLIVSHVMTPVIAQASTDAEIEAAVSPPMSVDIGADCGMNEAENAGGVNKKLLQAARTTSCTAIGLWSRSIIKHLYFAVQRGGGNGDLAVAVWLSITNHVQDKHHGHSFLYDHCQHGDLEPRKWIFPGYVDRLFDILNEYIDGAIPFALPAKPPHVTSALGPIDKTELVQSHLSWFQ
ncbi:hypothetical protein HPB52_003735 [Rhipicephalus sanguineus]|uniref:Uncharacterized protein n=1 Tax=Rhipicephalus sanguineus TaxID=34632 RepID=A0A9D4Q422_RHISA|nr:hypothetical protein HPB52_003735 [Rhipicephalus sanguineus]